MAQELISELHQRGIRLRLSDGGLEVLAPAGTLTDELREQLRSRRDELILLLSRAASADTPAQISADAVHRYEPFPLTDIQHAYWIGRSSAMELGGVSCHYYFELERAELDMERLNQSFRWVIARHDMLRAVVGPDGHQRILPQVPAYQIHVTDLRALKPKQQETELAKIRAEMDHQVLPSDRWPLFDIRACLLNDGRARLHVSLDVLIMDGASLYLLFQDWRHFYLNPDADRPTLDVSYRDYVLHEEAAREGDRHRADEAYWHDRLTSLPGPPALPLATQPAHIREPRFTRRNGSLPAKQWAAIKQIARERGLTASAVLIGAFAEVLRLWSVQPDFTLNLTLFNRPQLHPQINQVVGDFTSVTLLAAQALPDESFSARAGRLHQQLLRDLEHLSYSGVRVLRDRGRQLGGGPAAVMPVVFTSALFLASTEDDPSEGIGFFGERVFAISQTPQVWLDHQVAEERGELVFSWDAVEALFPDGLLDDMFSAYCALIERLSHDTEAWDRQGPLVGLPTWQAEQRAACNDTVAGIPPSTLCGLVEQRVQSQPDATAVIACDKRLTYREIASNARRLARGLQALGAKQNTLVGVVMDKGWEQVAAVLGVTLSGAAYLPVDPQWPKARRHELLVQGQAQIVVTTSKLRDELAWPPGIRLVTLADQGILQADDGPLHASPTPDDLAYVIFTSGSTGKPKGVMIDHGAAANTIQDINTRFRVGPDDRVLALSALSFDLSVYDIFGVLAAGGTVVLPSPAETHAPERWASLIAEHRVTLWNSVPALAQAWLDASPDSTPEPGLRLFLLSGDWIPVGQPDAIRSRYPDAQVTSLGGATEASIWSVCYPVREVPADWVRIPYGKPLANQQLHVYGDDFGPRPVWVTGEIYIGGAGVARGYWADAERTGERFVIHPQTSKRLYRTGDLGRYLPGGDIEFLGRSDSQIKLNGYRIELGEITVALHRLPQVAEATVSVAANPGTGRRQLVSHVVLASPVPEAAAAPVKAPTWQETISAGMEEFDRSRAELDDGLTAHYESWEAVERLCPVIMARSLAQLGLFTNAGQLVTSEAAITSGGIKHGYHGLVRQWLAALADAGMLNPTGSPGEYRCAQALDPESLDAQVRSGIAALESLHARDPLTDYVVSCIDNQTRMLRGEVSPLELLMAGGDAGATQALYAANPMSKLQNRVAAAMIRALVDASSPDAAVRILEVGAGTGGTTSTILPALAPGRVRYLFTDVSAYFIQRARTKFLAYPFTDYRKYDIDREPGAQGLAPGDADIVLAANVMHDAKDLDASLRHLASLLAPGGLLVLIEGTTNTLVQSITVGFIEGLAQDRGDERLPLLSTDQWRERTLAAGFTRFACIPQDPSLTKGQMQHVLIAEAPTPATQHETEAGILRRELEKVLPSYMVPTRWVLLDHLPLTANGKVDKSALPMPWDDESVTPSAAPRDDTEEQLLQIWREVLERDDFGVEDNFFELGGDSLHAVNMLAQLRDKFGLEASADEGIEFLFDHPTIDEMSAALREMPVTG
jgi:L-cysteine---[L-cysteinyl-carrier protein] ligase PchF